MAKTRELHALGRAAALARAARLRARGRRAPARARRRARAPPDASSGRLQWAREECEPLALSSDERDPEAIFARLPRIGGAERVGARRSRASSCSWRERTAARQDRPVQSVLGDATLIEIAKRRPSSRGELERIRGVGARAAAGAARRSSWRRSGAGASARPSRARAGARPPRRDPTTLRSSRWARRCCAPAHARRGSPTSCWPRARTCRRSSPAVRTGAEEADVRTLRGWRRELAGAELLELLDGNVAVGHRRGRPPIDRRGESVGSNSPRHQRRPRQSRSSLGRESE